MAISTFFSTPFYRERIDAKELSGQLKTTCLKLGTADYEKPNPPQGKTENVFESRFDFLELEDPSIIRLKSEITRRLISVIATVNNADPTSFWTLPFRCHSWFHITTFGGYFRPHTHPLASWSAVYCVDRGSPAVELSNGQRGDVVFYDPRGNASMFLDRTNRQMRRELSFNSFKISLETGDLLIFPSYLTHFVEPYMGKRERITVAANFWVEEYGNAE